MEAFCKQKESRLAFCWQSENPQSSYFTLGNPDATTALVGLAHQFFIKDKKRAHPHHPKAKQKGHQFGVLFVLAGMDGFEPSKCQSQSLVPYRLATSQYCVGIITYFILLVKHFMKKIIFYGKNDFTL